MHDVIKGQSADVGEKFANLMFNGDDEEGSMGFSTLIHLSSDIIFLAK